MRTLDSVVLASASPRRRELLASLGLTVEVVGSSYDEVPLPGRSPIETVRFHAEGKLDGAPRLPGLTIAADTIVDLEGMALGKPSSEADAARMLRMLSGREHLVHTAFALRDGPLGPPFVKSVTTAVRFAPLSDEMIAAYVASGDPLDKAGSYGIQGFAATLVERVAGDYFAVVGFPLAAFAQALPALGYRLMPKVAVFV